MTRMTPDKADQKIARAEEAIEKLTEATRAAHEVLAEFKEVNKEARAIKKEVEDIIEHRFDEKVEAQVADSMAKLEDATKQAMSDATDKVISEFDKLSDILMGRDRESKRKGRKSLPEMIEDKSKHEGRALVDLSIPDLPDWPDWHETPPSHGKNQ